MSKNAATITVLHNLFLTREERYKVAAGEEIETTGVSVPVWFHNGATSEPAQEVFCKYRLTHVKKPTPITSTEEGYVINMPQPEELMVTVADPTQEKLKLGTTVDPPSVDMLKDVKDGGCAYMHFKQYTKVKANKKTYNLLHFVEIKTMEDLLATLDYC